MIKLVIGCIIAAAMLHASMKPSPALAQFGSASHFSTIEVTRGTSVQLGVYAFANDDCTPARSPSIRVLEPPRVGMLTIRPGEFTTDTIANCASHKMPVQVALYAARPGNADVDHVIYEVTNPNGEVNIYEVTIRIR